MRPGKDVHLTVKERVLLHLLEFARHADAVEVPPEITQEGIARSVRIGERHVPQYVRPLVDEGLVSERRTHVEGSRQRRKVYDLTQSGRLAAIRLRARAKAEPGPGVEERGTRRGSVGRILAETEERAFPRAIPLATTEGRSERWPLRQEIRYCTTSDGVRIAYSFVGRGPPLVKAANWLSHLEFDWRSPVWGHWMEELARYHLLVRYDERGCGLSDWSVEEFSFDGWVRDLESVVDSLGIERFALLGISQGGAVAVEFAARHPERVSHLILYGAYARGWGRRGSPQQEREHLALMTLTGEGWGRDNPAYRQVFTHMFVPGASAEQMRWFNDLQRVSASPENAARFQKVFGDVDVGHRLSQVAVPTLVMHCRDDAVVPFEEGRRLAAMIPGAKFVPLEGANHILLKHEPAWDHFLGAVRAFLGVNKLM